MFFSHNSNKETNESDVLARLCRMLSTLDKYAQFEYVLCQDSKRFFAAEGTHLANTLSPSDFLALVDRRLQVLFVCFIVQLVKNLCCCFFLFVSL